jgi:stage V sporulation protein D (sporulation-specific penicillin-binding protein)
LTALPQLVTKRRTTYLLLAIFGMVGALFGRLFYLQILQCKALQKKAQEQRLLEVPVEAKRGWILDRRGRPLALSYDADCVYAHPVQVVNPKETARRLAAIIGRDAQKLEALLQKRVAFVWLKRKISQEEADAIRKARLPGVEVVQKAQRFYPQKDLASQVLGISGIDNVGLEGLELQYDSILRGTPGSEQAEFDSRGRRIPLGERRFVPPKDGNNLILTIDEYIQHIAERELEKAVRENGAKRGAVIMMDPMNGEVLAIATYPRFDPNHYSDYPAENRRNWALTDSYEPGSTFKVITSAAALEEGVVDLDSQFHDPGYIMVEDRMLRCWRAGGHGAQNFVEATENSCNPVFASLALRMGKDSFYNYIKAFGFGEKTQIDFPGEARGIMQASSRIKSVELATTGFGQGISVTPIQLLTGFSAAINGGHLLQPNLVKELQNQKGETIRRFGKKVRRRVISGSTSKKLTTILRSVVANGSGNRADVKGYRVAGKTGTAQKPSGGNYGQGRIASFLGFAPADSPRIAALIILDEPIGSIRYGGVIAAPVFAEITRDVLRYLGEPPRFEDEELKDKDGKPAVKVPNLLNYNRDEAFNRLKQEGLVGRELGVGRFVLEQQPKGGSIVPKGTSVLLYFDLSEKYNNSRDSQVKVPDLTGLSVEKAKSLLQGLGLVLVTEGTGNAVDQSPAPQTKVTTGSPVRVRFKGTQTQ